MTTPYAKQLTKEMGRLDFSWDAEKLERYVRGLNPWPGTYTFRDGQMLKIWAAEVCDGSYEAMPGTVVAVDKNSFSVQTGSGVLRVTEVQPQGKRRMSAEEYLRGYRLEQGLVLE